MIDILSTIGMLAGGLGLFMLAVSMITDGLKQAAGPSLQDILTRWTSSPFKGLVGGMSLTAIIQSSSAATIITIGFVNAGLINLFQALGIIFGANIGTTMTGWIVALIGFEIKVASFALPLIGLGAFLRLVGSGGRRASLGTAIAGFGLFFIGIGFLKEAFGGMAASINLEQFTADGVFGILLYLGIGFLMTLLTQSSSAAIAITLTAATGGVLGLQAAAAMVIGANVGTTSTAAFAAIGASANAKRVATAHVIFNVVTGIIALLILPLLFWLIEVTRELMELEAVPAVTLALFHTFFNIIGVLIMWPLASQLSAFLQKRFATKQESEERPQYLDKNTLASPSVAIHSLALEMTRLNAIVRRMALGALSAETSPDKSIRSDHTVVRNLSNAIAEYINQLEQATLSEDAINQLSRLLRCQQHLLACADQAHAIAIAQATLKMLPHEKLARGIAQYRSEVAKLLELAVPENDEFSLVDCNNQLDQVQGAYDKIKSDLTHAGTELHIPVHNIIDIIDQNSRIRRMARQSVKALSLLHEVNMQMEIKNVETDEVPESDEPEETE